MSNMIHDIMNTNYLLKNVMNTIFILKFINRILDHIINHIIPFTPWDKGCYPMTNCGSRSAGKYVPPESTLFTLRFVRLYLKKK